MLHVTPSRSRGPRAARCAVVRRREDERAVHRLRRPDEQRPRLLRQPDRASRRTSTSSPRRACGSTGPTASSRCATRAGRRFLTGLRPDTTRVYENATQFRKNVPDAQSLAADVPEGRLLRGPRRQALPLRRARRRSAPTASTTRRRGRRSINPRGRDKDDEEKTIFTLNPTAKGSARFGGTLSWLAADGTDAEQTDGKIAAEVDQAAGSEQGQAVLPGLRLLPPAHAVRRAEEVLRDVPAGQARRCRGAGGPPRSGPGAGVRQRQDGAGQD